jgi:biotin operon repressor
MPAWADLDADEREQIYKKRYEENISVDELAKELGGLNSVSLNRRLQEMREEKDQIEQPAPDFEILYNMLKKSPMTITQLADRLGIAPRAAAGLIKRMRHEGFVIEETRDHFKAGNRERPHVDIQKKAISKGSASMISFAIASDLHAGSLFAQPSARASFIELAYEEYGVRVVFDPGDLTIGVGGYRGQEFDIIPSLRPLGRFDYARTAMGEVWLADQYTPHFPGLKYYKLGGNHDYWCVSNAGIDPIYRLAQIRDDVVYLGYDVADIPLTDKIAVRLWHPGGGTGYSLSTRLQKGMEQYAYDELERAIANNENPNVQFLIAGHVHVETKFQRGNMVACYPGCFEGLTSYEKRKSLKPVIGGAIFRVFLRKNGLVERVEYTFVPYDEVMNDWKNWPVPEMESMMGEPEKVGEPIFGAV